MYIQIFVDINFVAAEYCVLVECLYTNVESVLQGSEQRVLTKEHICIIATH